MEGEFRDRGGLFFIPFVLHSLLVTVYCLYAGLFGPGHFVFIGVCLEMEDRYCGGGAEGGSSSDTTHKY